MEHYNKTSQVEAELTMKVSNNLLCSEDLSDLQATCAEISAEMLAKMGLPKSSGCLNKLPPSPTANLKNAWQSGRHRELCQLVDQCELSLYNKCGQYFPNLFHTLDQTQLFSDEFVAEHTQRSLEAIVSEKHYDRLKLGAIYQYLRQQKKSRLAKHLEVFYSYCKRYKSSRRSPLLSSLKRKVKKLSNKAINDILVKKKKKGSIRKIRCTSRYRLPEKIYEMLSELTDQFLEDLLKEDGEFQDELRQTATSPSSRCTMSLSSPLRHHVPKEPRTAWDSLESSLGFCFYSISSDTESVDMDDQGNSPLFPSTDVSNWAEISISNVKAERIQKAFDAYDYQPQTSKAVVSTNKNQRSRREEWNLDQWEREEELNTPPPPTVSDAEDSDYFQKVSSQMKDRKEGRNRIDSIEDDAERKQLYSLITEVNSVPSRDDKEASYHEYASYQGRKEAKEESRSSRRRAGTYSPPSDADSDISQSRKDVSAVDWVENTQGPPSEQAVDDQECGDEDIDLGDFAIVEEWEDPSQEITSTVSVHSTSPVPIVRNIFDLLQNESPVTPKSTPVIKTDEEQDQTIETTSALNRDSVSPSAGTSELPPTDTAPVSKGSVVKIYGDNLAPVLVRELTFPSAKPPQDDLKETINDILLHCNLSCSSSLTRLTDLYQDCVTKRCTQQEFLGRLSATAEAVLSDREKIMGHPVGQCRETVIEARAHVASRTEWWASIDSTSRSFMDHTNAVLSTILLDVLDQSQKGRPKTSNKNIDVDFLLESHDLGVNKDSHKQRNVYNFTPFSDSTRRLCDVIFKTDDRTIEKSTDVFKDRYKNSFEDSDFKTQKTSSTKISDRSYRKKENRREYRDRQPKAYSHKSYSSKYDSRSRSPRSDYSKQQRRSSPKSSKVKSPIPPSSSPDTVSSSIPKETASPKPVKPSVFSQSSVRPKFSKQDLIASVAQKSTKLQNNGDDESLASGSVSTLDGVVTASTEPVGSPATNRLRGMLLSFKRDLKRRAVGDDGASASADVQLQLDELLNKSKSSDVSGSQMTSKQANKDKPLADVPVMTSIPLPKIAVPNLPEPPVSQKTPVTPASQDATPTLPDLQNIPLPTGTTMSRAFLDSVPLPASPPPLPPPFVKSLSLPPPVVPSSSTISLPPSFMPISSTVKSLSLPPPAVASSGSIINLPPPAVPNSSTINLPPLAVPSSSAINLPPVPVVPSSSNINFPLPLMPSSSIVTSFSYPPSEITSNSTVKSINFPQPSISGDMIIKSFNPLPSSISSSKTFFGSPLPSSVSNNTTNVISLPKDCSGDSIGSPASRPESSKSVMTSHSTSTFLMASSTAQPSVPVETPSVLDGVSHDAADMEVDNEESVEALPSFYMPFSHPVSTITGIPGLGDDAWSANECLESSLDIDERVQHPNFSAYDPLFNYRGFMPEMFSGAYESPAWRPECWKDQCVHVVNTNEDIVAERVKTYVEGNGAISFDPNHTKLLPHGKCLRILIHVSSTEDLSFAKLGCYRNLLNLLNCKHVAFFTFLSMQELVCSPGHHILPPGTICVVPDPRVMLHAHPNTLSLYLDFLKSQNSNGQTWHMKIPTEIIQEMENFKKQCKPSEITRIDALFSLLKSSNVADTVEILEERFEDCSSFLEILIHLRNQLYKKYRHFSLLTNCAHEEADILYQTHHGFSIIPLDASVVYFTGKPVIKTWSINKVTLNNPLWQKNITSTDSRISWCQEPLSLSYPL